MSKNTNLSFLTDFLTADIVNSRVGMNNVSPQATFDVTGTGKFSGILTLGSTVSNGTYTYTLPSATGTLALTSDIPSVSGYVPYTGATQAVDLGTNDLTSRYVVANGSPALGGVISMKQDAAYIAKGNGYSSIASSFNSFDFFGYTGASTYKNFQLRFDGLTNNTLRTFTLPDADGTIALTSSLGAYLPLAGGTMTGPLNGTSATFTGDLIAASATINTPANAVGVLVNGRTSDNFSQIRFGANTGGGAYNTIQASPTSFDIISQGNTPITFGTNLGGGGGTRMTILGTGGVTLTGALNGTSAVFSSSVTVNGASSTTSFNVKGSGPNGILLDEDLASATSSSRLFFKTNTQTYAVLADVNGLNFLSGATAGSSSGTPKMTLTSSGSLGIGTASLTTGKLVVKSGESNSTGIVLERGDSTDKLVNIFSTTADGKISISSGANTKIFLDSVGASYFTNGNVGIGLVLPRSILEVQKTTGNTSLGIASNALLTLSQGGSLNELSQIGFGYTQTASPAVIGFITTSGASNTKGDLLFATRDVTTDTAPTERMRITSDGNVLLSSNKNIGINTTDGSDDGYLAISGAGSDGPSRGGHIYLSGNERVADAGTAVISAGNVATGSVIFRTGASTPRMTITSGGSVCINRQDSPYGNFAVKSNSSTSYAGINVYASTSERFIAINHTGAEGVIESEFAGGGFTPLSFKAGGSERMRISDTGAITMSVPTSGQTLTISGKNNNWTQEIVGSSTTGQSYGLLITAGTNSSDYPIYAQNQAGNTVLFRVRGDGVINTGTASGSPYNNTSAQIPNLYVSSGGTLERGTASSGRFKENIINWDGNGLDTILALKPKTFKYKKDYYNKADIDFLGLIAEDVSQVSPYLADYENEDRTGQVENVRYATIVVPLIKAIQELKAELDELKNKLS